MGISIVDFFVWSGLENNDLYLFKKLFKLIHTEFIFLFQKYILGVF